MQRLLQFGSFLLILVTISAPIAALLDRWDPPSLGNDTEMTVFALVLVLCLLVLVCRLIAAFAMPLSKLCNAEPDGDQAALTRNCGLHTMLFIPPKCASPLRI